MIWLYLTRNCAVDYSGSRSFARGRPLSDPSPIGHSAGETLKDVATAKSFHVCRRSGRVAGSDPIGCYRHPLFHRPGLGATELDHIHAFNANAVSAGWRERREPELDFRAGRNTLSVVGLEQRRRLAGNRRGQPDKHHLYTHGCHSRHHDPLHRPCSERRR